MIKETLSVSDNNYHETMMAIYELMNKGEMVLTDVELEKLQRMTIAAEKYEDEIWGLKPKCTGSVV